MRNTTLKCTFIILLFIASGACKKASDSKNVSGTNNRETLQLISGQFGFSDWPQVENGMLVFSNEAHFEKYIAFLDEAVDPQNYDSVRTDDKGDTLEFDQDKILEAIETDLGFTSARKIAHDPFLQLNEIGWERLEDIPEEHFIRDAVMRSVLNSDLTVKIGGQYVHVINKALSVRVDGSKEELLSTFRNLPESAALYDALDIDRGHQFSSVFEIKPTGELSTFGSSKFGAHTLGFVSIINLNVTSPECGNPKKKYFSNMQMFEAGNSFGDPGTSMGATFNVNFGDGSPILTIHSMQDGFYQVVPTFMHTYANAGTYNVHVQAQADNYPPGGGATTASRDEVVIVRNVNCKTGDRKKIGTEQFYVVGDGSRAVSGRITVDNYTGWGSNTWKTRIIAETSSWLRNGNKWKQSKAEIWHNLHTNKHDAGCNITGSVDGDGWASKAKHILTHRTDDRYPWDVVHTNHAIKHNGTWYNFPQSLSVCD